MSIQKILASVSLALLFFFSVSLHADDNAKTEVMNIPALENPDGSNVGAYKALSDWTNLTTDERIDKVLKEALIPTKDPKSGVTTLLKADDVINGNFSFQNAIYPQELVNNTEARADNYSKLTTKTTLPSTGPTKSNSQPWSTNMIILLTGIVVFFGTAILISGGHMARHGAKPHTIIRFNGLVLVVVAAVLLVIMGYSQEQISPVIGLLGAVAGYLLGDRSSEDGTST